MGYHKNNDENGNHLFCVSASVSFFRLLSAERLCRFVSSVHFFLSTISAHSIYVVASIHILRKTEQRSSPAQQRSFSTNIILVYTLTQRFHLFRVGFFYCRWLLLLLLFRS